MMRFDTCKETADLSIPLRSVALWRIDGDEQQLGPAAASYAIPSSRLAEASRERDDKACALCKYRRVKPRGAPGLAFETWDPSNQFLLETPTHRFVIRDEAEGSAVPRTFRGNAQLYPQTELSSRPERSGVERSAVLFISTRKAKE
jgi:hypothetical protein